MKFPIKHFSSREKSNRAFDDILFVPLCGIENCNLLSTAHRCFYPGKNIAYICVHAYNIGSHGGQSRGTGTFTGELIHDTIPTKNGTRHATFSSAATCKWSEGSRCNILKVNERERERDNVRMRNSFASFASTIKATPSNKQFIIELGRLKREKRRQQQCSTVSPLLTITLS